MIFQDPYASLNPRWRVKNIIAEPLRELKLRNTPAEVIERVEELLRTVGLSASDGEKFPHEFSGGQRQRYIHRPRTGERAGIPRLRRADLGARCFGSGTGSQPYAPAAGRAGSDLSFHQATT